MSDQKSSSPDQTPERQEAADPRPDQPAARPDAASERPADLPADQEPAPVPVEEMQGDGDRFVWHPEYRGRSVDEVREELRQEIASDQRQYAVAMEGAEEAEQDVLASVVELERKWGKYDFGWTELDANDLARRIVAFEHERDQRREMISWSDYRESHGPAGGMTDSGEPRPAELSTRMKAISLGLVVLLIVLILLAVWAL